MAAHKFWRLSIYRGIGLSHSIALSEMALKETPAGANVIGDATITSSGDYSTDFAVSNLADGDQDTFWLSSSGGQAWVIFEFATTKDIQEIDIRSGPFDAIYRLTAPRTITWDWSDDGIWWQSADAYHDESEWTTKELRTYTIATDVYVGRRWRLWITASEDVNFLNLTEFELRGSTGGADHTQLSRASASASDINGPASEAIDDDTTGGSYWYVQFSAGAGGPLPHYLLLTYPYPVRVAQYVVQQATADYPTAWELHFSINAHDYYRADSQTAQPGGTVTKSVTIVTDPPVILLS